MSSTAAVSIRRGCRSDPVEEWLTRFWGDPRIAVHGELYDASTLPCLVAERAAEVVGLLTYTEREREVEIVTCSAEPSGQGIGRALVSSLIEEFREHGVRRVWCTTTNDNLPALAFWQRLGFRLVALRPRAVDEARKLKPQIPELGHGGLPLRDELDLELMVA